MPTKKPTPALPPLFALLALTAALTAALPAPLLAQQPSITAVVDAASYHPTLGLPGAIATIYGTSLAASTASASSFPLPRQLAGVTVTWYGVATPLFYVSPTQINFQVPTAADQTPGIGNSPGAVVTTAPGGTSAPYDPQNATPSAWQAGGLFSQNSSGCGPGSILNVSPSGAALSLNSTANSAAPGSWISAYGTAIYEPYPGTDGEAAPANPSPKTGGNLEAILDLGSAPSLTLFDESSFWGGLAPGFAGLAQYNVRLPETLREGCAVPLQIGYNQSITQPVVLSVHRGGGPCSDPPEAGLGRILWQKSISETTGAPVASESLTVSLQASPGKLAPPPSAFTDTCTQPGNVCTSTLPEVQTPSGPACAMPGYISLDAGAVTASGPGLPSTPVPSLPYQDGHIGGLSAYQANLPSGTIQSGHFTVSASGGANVAAFQASLTIGSDIEIQTPLSGIAAWQNCQNFTVTWTGGDPNSWVTLQFVLQHPGYSAVVFAFQTRTSRGGITIPEPLSCPQGAPTPALLRIQVDPDPSEIAPFSAPGITLGGQASWRYIHDFAASYSVGPGASPSQ